MKRDDQGPLTDPIPFGPNLVSRFYQGGGRLAALRAAAGHAIDASACEDWVGSATAAWSSEGSTAEGEGLSRLPHGAVLADVARDRPDELVGTAMPGGTTGVLVKLLDAGVRLPVHAHPTRAFAARHLGSAWGKSEAWIVLDTWSAGPEPPHIRLGWRAAMTRDRLLSLIGEQRSDELVDAMPVVPVRAGEVWFVPAGVPHAIGAGVFMVEVQEPTDFSIVAETRGFPIRPEDGALGRGWDLMVDAFDLEAMTRERLAALRQVPTPVGDRDRALRRTALLGADAARVFRAERLDLTGDAPWPFGGWAVAIVLEGQGEARGETQRLSLGRGVTFGVPAAAAREVHLRGESLGLIVCRPGTEPPAGDVPAG